MYIMTVFYTLLTSYKPHGGSNSEVGAESKVFSIYSLNITEWKMTSLDKTNSVSEIIIIQFQV